MGDREDIGEAARQLRPVGYFGIGLVWLALTIVSLALWVALPLILSATAGSLHDAPGIVVLGEDKSELTAFLLCMIILPPFFAYLLLAVTVGCASLMLLAFAYFARSLSGRYDHEKLSRTEHHVDAIGPPIAAFMPKAISLLPVHRSRYTDALSTLVTLSFRPGGGIVMSAWVLGLDYFFVVGWALWPVHGALLVACIVVSLALAVLGVWLLVRSASKRYRSLLTEPSEAESESADTAH